jgi:type II secretory pathway component HofQ
MTVEELKRQAKEWRDLGARLRRLQKPTAASDCEKQAALFDLRAQAELERQRSGGASS